MTFIKTSTVHAPAIVNASSAVMAGLDPATHVFATAGVERWVLGPGMTTRVLIIARLHADGTISPQTRPPPILARRRSAAGRDLSRQHRGIDGRRLQRGAAGSLGVASGRREFRQSASSDALTLVATMDGSPLGFASLEGQRPTSTSSSSIPQLPGRASARCCTSRRKARHRAGRAAPHRGSERHRDAVLPEARISTAAPQYGDYRRRMARQHHHGQGACGSR